MWSAFFVLSILPKIFWLCCCYESVQVKVGLRLKVTNKFKAERRLSCRPSTSCFSAPPVSNYQTLSCTVLAVQLTSTQ